MPWGMSSPASAGLILLVASRCAGLNPHLIAVRLGASQPKAMQGMAFGLSELIEKLGAFIFRGCPIRQTFTRSHGPLAAQLVNDRPIWSEVINPRSCFLVMEALNHGCVPL